MDFHLSDDLLAAQELAHAIFSDHGDVAQVVAAEATPTRVDARLWEALVDAGLTGLHLPASAGGDDMGLAGLAVVLTEQGRVVAPVPLWSVAVGAYAVARHAPEALASQTLGAGRITVALEEFAAAPDAPRCAATQAGDGWLLTGDKATVPTPTGAATVLVSAQTPNGPALFLVASDAPGASWESTETTSRDLAGNLRLEQTPASWLGGAEALDTTLQAGALAVAALQLGVGQGALDLTARYLTDRHQFGRPLGSFQAVQHQLADCWIGLEASRVTLWQAILAFDDLASATAYDGESDASGDDHSGSSSPPSDERGDLARKVAVARAWCGQAGADLVHRTQHLHGGIGVDVDYPIHRYYLWGKQLAGTLGGPHHALAELGDLLAGTEVRS